VENNFINKKTLLVLIKQGAKTDTIKQDSKAKIKNIIISSRIKIKWIKISRISITQKQ
jgi:hypothetical protein